MKIKIQLLGLFCAFSLMASAQLSKVHTSKDDVLTKKYEEFVIVDEATNYVMAKSPVKYSAGNQMPSCYFTLDLPSGVTSLTPGTPRWFVIHTLEVSDEDWVLENNKAENDMFFGRGRFVVNAINKQWLIQVVNDKVVFKSRYNNKYLKIDENGDYKPVADMSQASKWKLYHVID